MKRMQGLAVLAAALAALAAPALADPVKIRIGHGAAVEEQLWLMKALPKATPNQGKAYTLEFTLFPGTDKRFQAYEGGALDGATTSANTAIFAASEGMQLKAVASLSQESKRGFYTLYLAKADSPIKSIKDLKGKTIGINGLRTSTELWAVMALKQAGLDPTKDVTFVPVPFPVQGEAVRSGKVDVGVFPQPFARVEEQKGGLKTVFTSKDAIPFDEELMLVVLKPDFIAKNPDAVRAFLADLRSANQFYLANLKEARQALIDSKMIRTPAAIFLDMPDYYRSPDMKIDVAAMAKMQDLQMEMGWQRKRIDVTSIVDQSLMPK